ncbi:MAG: hypothetical protein ACKV2U_02380 [Bryobacteraceae bacterium]
MRISRRTVLLAIPLAGCGPSQSAATEPPKMIHGGWARETMEEQPATAVPESIRSLNPTKVWRVTYKGPQDITGLWILYPSETVAFEAIQKLNKNLSIRPFYRGMFLVVLDATGVPPQALGDFQEGVAKALP